MWKGFFDIREYMGKNFNFKQISNSYVIQEPNQVGQAIKSVGRMTWHQEPKKDVTSCEKLRLGANIHRPADIRMGKPGTAIPHQRALNKIGVRGERPELKHLSRGRKRHQPRFR